MKPSLNLIAAICGDCDCIQGIMGNAIQGIMGIASSCWRCSALDLDTAGLVAPAPRLLRLLERRQLVPDTVAHLGLAWTRSLSQICFAMGRGRCLHKNSKFNSQGKNVGDKLFLSCPPGSGAARLGQPGQAAQP